MQLCRQILPFIYRQGKTWALSLQQFRLRNSVNAFLGSDWCANLVGRQHMARWPRWFGILARYSKIVFPGRVVQQYGTKVTRGPWSGHASNICMDEMWKWGCLACTKKLPSVLPFFGLGAWNDYCRNFDCQEVHCKWCVTEAYGLFSFFTKTWLVRWWATKHLWAERNLCNMLLHFFHL